MSKITCYRGHIRNWEALASELNIDAKSMSREAREEAILLAAYEAWHEDMGNHLHGMFALAIEDGDKLFAIRDQFGTKPFYYYITEDGKLLYGTYIRDILTQPGFEKKLNEKMLQLYLSLTYVAGEETFFDGIMKLMPGQFMIFENEELYIEEYWSPDFAHPDEIAEEKESLEDFADEIHETMQQMFREVKTPDEKVESFLSGGVDSSYVFALSDAEEADTCGYEEARSMSLILQPRLRRTWDVS